MLLKNRHCGFHAGMGVLSDSILVKDALEEDRCDFAEEVALLCLIRE